MRNGNILIFKDGDKIKVKLIAYNVAKLDKDFRMFNPSSTAVPLKLMMTQYILW